MRRSVVAIAAGLGLAAGVLLWFGGRRVRRRLSPPRRTDEQMDEALIETFPASDPPAGMGSLVSGSPKRTSRRA